MIFLPLKGRDDNTFKVEIIVVLNYLSLNFKLINL